MVSIHKTARTDLLSIIASWKLLTPAEVKYLRGKFTSDADRAEELLERKIVTDEQLARALAVTSDLPLIHLQGKTVPLATLQTVPLALAKQYLIVAYELTEDALKLAVGRPYRLTDALQSKLDELAKIKQHRLELAVAPIRDVVWLLEQYQRQVGPEHLTAAPVLKTSNLPRVDLRTRKIAPAVLTKFPQDIAERYKMVVFDSPDSATIAVALEDPNDKKAQDLINFIARRNDINVKLFQTSPESIAVALKQYHPESKADATGSPQADVTSPAQAGTTVHPTPVPVVPVPPPDFQPPSDQPVPTSDTLPAIQSLAEAPKTNVAYQPDLSTQTAPATSSSPTQTGVLGAPTSELDERNLDKFLGQMTTTPEQVAEFVKAGNVPKIVASILSYAITKQASDVHLEPSKDGFGFRLRVDGELREVLNMPKALHPPVISRIKILADLKIDEQRVPQDGRYDATASGHEFDVRVSTLPTIFGEKVVMRVLDKTQGIKKLTDLGFDGENLKRISDAIGKPFGIVLATGPTGSGKSTTLYAILNQLASPKSNIITLEDPVEYEIKGVNQVQVKPRIGFTFAEGLRSVLRQDPNIIMVGEIRDKETANLATQAALTGHLVLSTLHTNDASGALPRLVNMGVEPFLITTSINAVIAQRLVRKLCQRCKVSASLPAQVLEEIKTALGPGASLPASFYGASQGCPECNNGFKGRIGIYEVLLMSDTIEQAVLDEKPAGEISALALKEGMVTMRHDGINKAAQGLTTVDEVLKTTVED